ncbi:hypothetical protein MRX96_053562, partial [Rhipicephalus microplus]
QLGICSAVVRKGEGYDETISASIHRDVDAWESAQARLSRSADATRRGVSIDKGPSVGTYTGRPLARQRRKSGWYPTAGRDASRNRYFSHKRPRSHNR